MRKILLSIICINLACGVLAGKLPDHMYFNAMKDEMARTLKSLKRPGAPRPFYVAYKVEHLQQTSAAASLGALYPTGLTNGQIDLFAVLDIGSPKEDSLGYANESYYYEYAYAPRASALAGNNYAALRQALWTLTDEAYVFATETYRQKQAYKRRKNMPSDRPDFVPGKQDSYTEKIPQFAPYPQEKLEDWVRQLSAQGQSVAYLEQFGVEISPVQKDTYYLNSLGGFYQVSQAAVYVEWSAQLRNKDGYKKRVTKQIWLREINENTLEELTQKTAEFLAQTQNIYQAKKAGTYVGPVLLTPSASGGLVEAVLVRNAQYMQPLLSGKTETDPKAGKWRDKLGLRVLSNAVDVYDRPQLREFNGKPLGGFMPVDDEGVAAQELALVTGGKLRTLARSSRPVEKGAASNGHARMTDMSLPREMLSNVFVEPKNPLSAQKLEETLLEKCRALELEYCYILSEFPSMKQNQTDLISAKRIYSADGHKETVYGLKVSDLTPRALRDIVAAGNDSDVTYVQPLRYGGDFLPMQSIVAPSLLLEELELVPDDKKADKAPFVKKPE